MFTLFKFVHVKNNTQVHIRTLNRYSFFRAQNLNKVLAKQKYKCFPNSTEIEAFENKICRFRNPPDQLIKLLSVCLSVPRKIFVF